MKIKRVLKKVNDRMIWLKREKLVQRILCDWVARKPAEVPHWG
jgi:hypothetical protein